MITAALIVIVLSLIAYCVKKGWEINQTFKKRGIKHFKPLLFFGNNLPVIFNYKSQNEVLEDIYNTYPKESVVGYYEYMTPQLLVRDPELVQRVLIKDFGHFVDHGFEVNVEKNPTDDQLFVMTGNRWRAFRVKMTPIFTSGKLKDIFEAMTSCGKNLIEYVELRKNEDIDMRELMGLFSMDVIGAAVFGMDPATLKNPECDFRRIGRKLINPTYKNIIRMIVLFAFPALAKKLGLSFMDVEATKYYIGLIQDNIRYRKDKGLYRNDFVQMLMQLKDKGTVEVQTWDTNDDYLKTNENVANIEKYEINDNIIMAQAQSFMVAGFETTALLIMYTFFEMTQNPEIQEKAREEVLSQVKLNGGLTYDALKNMKYVEACIKETQRIYPMVPYLFRICTKDYTLPDGHVVKKGDRVAIPITGLHKDPNYFPEPNAYKPERFFEPISPGTYLPFGEGPRMCLAMRYALLVMKYGIAILLMNHKVTLSEKTKVPLKLDSRFFSALPANKVLMKIERIK